jgi:hypothetical protein
MLRRPGVVVAFAPGHTRVDAAQMWRYKLMRGTVNGLERGSHVVFSTIRWGIDRLERRDETRKLRATVAELTPAGVDDTARDSLQATVPPG